jgi:putative OPT family oligopeptide transporter
MLTMSIVMIVAGFLFSAVAGYMAGIVGSSNNPVSGITIATILFTALLLRLLIGPDASLGAPAAIMVGAVVCCAAAIGGDNLQDLKAGHLLGATPWCQQLMQAVGVISSAVVMALILNLLLDAYGIGAPTDAQPNALAAPQAQIMASVAAGIFGAGLPWGMVAAGGVVGLGFILLDEWLQSRGSSWRTPVLAVAVGIYLPLELSVPIFIGGVIARLAAGAVPGRDADGSDSGNGMLFAAGLITGEALVGILMAIPIVLAGDPNVFALGIDLPAGVGVAVIVAIGLALWRIARGARSVSDERPG